MGRHVEKVSGEALRAQSRQHMKKDHDALKKKLSQIDERFARPMSEAAMNILDGVTENLGAKAAQDMYTGNTGNNPVAALAQHGMPYHTPGMTPVMHGDWQPQAILKETRIGKEVERYRVTNTKTGAKYDELFRHHAVALQIAAILNETNNPNDPRIRRLNEWAQQEESILLETSKLVKKYKSTEPGNTSRKTIVKNKIDHNKLILENVRLKMGVL